MRMSQTYRKKVSHAQQVELVEMQVQRKIKIDATAERNGRGIAEDLKNLRASALLKALFL